MESNTVKRLVAEAKSGSREAFDELVRITYPRLLSKAISMTGNLEDARDAVQDAYIRAYKSLASLKGDAKFVQWMQAIVGNTASSLAAKARRRKFELIGKTTGAHEESESAKAERERDPTVLADIWKAVEALPEQLRRVFILKDLYGLEHQEVADRLGISESNAKVRLHRARKILQSMLTEHRKASAG